MVRLAKEGINHYGNEEIHEHLWYQDLEYDEEGDRHGRAAGEGFSAVGHHCLISFIITTLVSQIISAGEVEHDQMPRLTSCTSHEKKEWIVKVSEVCVLIELVVWVSNFDQAKDRASNDCKHEEEDH